MEEVDFKELYIMSLQKNVEDLTTFEFPSDHEFEQMSRGEKIDMIMRLYVAADDELKEFMYETMKKMSSDKK